MWECDKIGQLDCHKQQATSCCHQSRSSVVTKIKASRPHLPSKHKASPQSPIPITSEGTHNPDNIPPLYRMARRIPTWLQILLIACLLSLAGTTSLNEDNSTAVDAQDDVHTSVEDASSISKNNTTVIFQRAIQKAIGGGISGAAAGAVQGTWMQCFMKVETNTISTEIDGLSISLSFGFDVASKLLFSCTLPWY